MQNLLNAFLRGPRFSAQPGATTSFREFAQTFARMLTPDEQCFWLAGRRLEIALQQRGFIVGLTRDGKQIGNMLDVNNQRAATRPLVCEDGHLRPADLIESEQYAARIRD